MSLIWFLLFIKQSETFLSYSNSSYLTYTIRITNWIWFLTWSGMAQTSCIFSGSETNWGRCRTGTTQTSANTLSINTSVGIAWCPAILISTRIWIKMNTLLLTRVFGGKLERYELKYNIKQSIATLSDENRWWCFSCSCRCRVLKQWYDTFNHIFG